MFTSVNKYLINFGQKSCLWKTCYWHERTKEEQRIYTLTVQVPVVRCFASKAALLSYLTWDQSIHHQTHTCCPISMSVVETCTEKSQIYKVTTLLLWKPIGFLSNIFTVSLLLIIMTYRFDPGSNYLRRCAFIYFSSRGLVYDETHSRIFAG